jgi:hypothetical protein
MVPPPTGLRENRYMTINLQPGDLGFATIAGGVGGLINFGQAILHDACRFTHVFVVVRPVGDPGTPDGQIVEAMPRGARLRPLADRLRPGYAYASVDLTDAQRAQIVDIAYAYINARNGRGIGYSFGTYLALALAQYRLTRWTTPGLERIIDNRGRLICSQLADDLLMRIGEHAFADSRWRGDVTPADLYYRYDPRVIQPAPPSVDGA